MDVMHELYRDEGDGFLQVENDAANLLNRRWVVLSRHHVSGLTHAKCYRQGGLFR